MTIVYLGLGTNLGDRGKNLSSALDEISNIGKITEKSQIHETEPEGFKDQNKFLNMVIEMETELSPTELIIKLQEIEHKLGKVVERLNGPRKIDLDILLYGDKKIELPGLKIPHPRMHKRTFVLGPLSEINENLIHPTLKKSIKELANELGKN